MSTASKPETRRRGVAPTANQKGSEEAASGFILKLFQMVNGAPDEVISWTPSGDAFIIGSDLKRLESETLPQYFRHNRFPSLVRQLNFYSFRKINRERNVWIYKHSLFHRDRPEDLHMVRRRTCPGMDGRKQRLSRFSARKLGVDAASDDDDSSVDAAAVEEVLQASCKKRDLDLSENGKSSKRVRRQVLSCAPKKEEPVLVDTSMIQKKQVEELEQIDDEASLSVARKGGSELAEQSMIVSEVAEKLEQYARKALKGRGGSRTRRGGSGVVTPPYAASRNYLPSSSSLLTYDDEYEFDEDKDVTGRGSASSSLGVITETDSMASDDEPSSLGGEPNTVTPTKAKEFLSPPVVDKKVVESITARIKANNAYADVVDLSATMAGFCMSTSPNGDKDLCSKILQLLVKSDAVNTEFRLYRAALHPLDQADKPSPAFWPTRPENRAITVQQIWESQASRVDAVRDFKIFAANCVHKLLGTTADMRSCKFLSDEDKTILERTVGVWQKSA